MQAGTSLLDARHKIIPMIESRAQFSQILVQNRARAIMLRHCNLFDMVNLMESAYRKGYLLYIDIDSCDGIHPDEAGVRYLATHLHVSGIISHHPRVLVIGKQQGLETVQRIFAVDSTGLESELEALDLQATDVLSISPALVIPHISVQLAKRSSIPFIGAGLIASHEQVQIVLQAGALRVMTTRPELWS